MGIPGVRPVSFIGTGYHKVGVASNCLGSKSPALPLFEPSLIRICSAHCQRAPLRGLLYYCTDRGDSAFNFMLALNRVCPMIRSHRYDCRLIRWITTNDRCRLRMCLLRRSRRLWVLARLDHRNLCLQTVSVCTDWGDSDLTSCLPVSILGG